MRTIRSFVLHHTAIDSEEPQFDRVDASHKQRFGTGIQYHFLIERDGEIKGGKPVEEIGYHAGNYEINVESIGICLAGDFRYQQPNQAQMDSLTELLLKYQNIYHIPDENIYLHREVKLQPTACPVVDVRESFLARKEVALWKRLVIAQRGLKLASSRRRRKLLRLINRIKRRLGIISN